MRRTALRHALAILLFVASQIAPAAAGDGSAINPLGFSADGRYFAFEQFGEQDGSGALFSSISAIEVSGDLLIKGFPITASINPDETNRTDEPRAKILAEARAKATADAAPMLKKLGISVPGRMIASARKSRTREVLDHNPVKAVREAVTRTITLPRDRFAQGAQLVLKEFDVALPRCKELVVEGYPNGFGLTIERKGQPTIHLHRDQTIPTARGCPDRYGIAEVHALYLPDGSTALAALIQYFYQGFEGPDRRFLVVSGRVK